MDANRTQRQIAAITRIAERLRNAYAEGQVAPLRDVLAPSDGAGAYAVQSINTSHWVASGRRIVGRKIGLTSAAVQAQLGVDQPDHGVLFDDMIIASGGALLASRVRQPRAEAEVALVMRRDLDDPHAQPVDVLAATDHAVAAIEIVDSRITDWKITFADTVADNASSAFFVLGDERRSLERLDLAACAMQLQVNGATVSSGSGAACLRSPLLSAAWLVRALAAAGQGLRAGDIVLTGALGPMVDIRPGDVVHATVEGVGSCGFVFQEDR
jgi:2-keto-4-pentenoate hydratase